MKNIYLDKAYSHALENLYEMSCIQLPIVGDDGSSTNLPIFKKNNQLFVGVLFEKTGISSQLDNNISSLLPKALEYAEKNNINQVRVFTTKEIMGMSNFLPDKVNMVLKLPETTEELWKSFKTKMRNNIKNRPEKHGYHYTILNAKESLEIFYDIYTENIHSLGSLHLPFSFFQEILEKFEDRALIYIGYLKDKPVCTAFMTFDETETFIPWAGSLREYNKYNITMAMYWSMLEWSIKAGKTQFNFGRSDRGSGTYTFKKRWGATEQQLYMYHIPVHQPSILKEKIYKKVNMIIQNSPKALMHLASRQFVKKFF